MQLTPCPRQSGFLLIEVLVSMLLAAVAVIALTRVHAAALQGMRASGHRALALQLASDLAERLRANRSGALHGPASAYQFLAPAAPAAAADPLASLCDGPAAVCAPADLARADVAQWSLLLRRQLPQGAAWVQVDATQGLADIWIAWRDVADADDAALASGAACPAALGGSGSGSLRCLMLRVAW